VDPDRIFSFPAQPEVPCGVLQSAGISGSIPLDECGILAGANLANDQCGCAVCNPPPPPDCPVIPANGCSICGEGKAIVDPDRIFSFPAQPEVPCGVLQSAGISGSIPLDECGILASANITNDKCGCVACNGPRISPQTSSPTLAPVTPIPTNNPTPDPTAVPTFPPTSAPIAPTPYPVLIFTPAPVLTFTLAPVDEDEPPPVKNDSCGKKGCKTKINQKKDRDEDKKEIGKKEKAKRRRRLIFAINDDKEPNSAEEKAKQF